MYAADLGDLVVHLRDDGPRDGPALVFAHSLSADMRIWDPILPHLPAGLRLIRYDLRGHGLSGCPPAPYAMGALVRDAERLIETLGLSGVTFVGLSIGGMIAQGLAVKRPDLVARLVLSNTAAKIATPEIWQQRIEAARGPGGIESFADEVMARWFTRRFRDSAEAAPWRRMMVRTPVEGYAGCAAAIAGSDFYTPTSGLRLPTLAIAADQDGSTPPDLVRETADLIPGARFELIRDAGHIPCVERPADYAALLADFLAETGA